MSAPGVLFVGNFLSMRACARAYCEDLTVQLESRAWKLVRTSHERGRVRRLADMLATAWTARRDYRIAHVDVYSGNGFFWAEAVCFELRRLGKPVILTLHGGSLPEFARRWPRRARALLGGAAAVTAPSGYQRDAMASYAHEIRIVPNAIAAAGCAFALRDAPRARLVWLRSFHALYNPALAIDVLARIPGATLVMVGADKGDGSYAATERHARELGVRDRVALVSGVPKHEVPRYLAAGDIFLNTTDADNTPISVLEAMASGLCVVSTSVGGIPYMLAHEQNALLVPPRDATAMTRAVERLLREPGLAARLSAHAREYAVARDWSRVLPQWEALFAEVLARA